MLQFSRITVLLSTAGIMTLSQHMRVGVIEFVSLSNWQSAVTDYVSVDFTDYPKFTFITDQYSGLGVTFIDGDDNIEISNGFPPDLFGLDGNQSITMDFNSPQHWIGVNFPGEIIIDLYSDNALIYTSSIFGDDGPPGAFAGLVSGAAFNRAVMYDLGPDVNIGDLYFGPPIPAPGAIVMFAAAALTHPRRRRRR